MRNSDRDAAARLFSELAAELEQKPALITDRSKAHEHSFAHEAGGMAALCKEIAARLRGGIASYLSPAPSDAKRRGPRR